MDSIPDELPVRLYRITLKTNTGKFAPCIRGALPPPSTSTSLLGISHVPVEASCFSKETNGLGGGEKPAG